MREPRRDYYVAPATDDDSRAVLDSAIEALGTLRGLEWVGDAGATLHLLASLVAEATDPGPPRRGGCQGPGVLLGTGRRPVGRHSGQRLAALRRPHGSGQDAPGARLRRLVFGCAAAG